jgi:hypothetical protein
MSIDCAVQTKPRTDPASNQITSSSPLPGASHTDTAHRRRRDGSSFGYCHYPEHVLPPTAHADVLPLQRRVRGPSPSPSPAASTTSRSPASRPAAGATSARTPPTPGATCTSARRETTTCTLGACRRRRWRRRMTAPSGHRGRRPSSPKAARSVRTGAGTPPALSRLAYTW